MTDQGNSGEDGLYCLDDWKKEKVYLPVENWVTDERELTCSLEAHSIISLEGIIIIELDFTGREDILWQLERFVAKYDLFHIFTLLNIRPWTETRNIPCKIKFRWNFSRRCVSYFFQMLFGLALIKIDAHLRKL